MQLSKIDDMANLVGSLPTGSCMFKTDLRKGYEELCLDPLSLPLTGFQVDSKLHINTSPTFGLRSAASMMQHTTEAVA